MSRFMIAVLLLAVEAFAGPGVTRGDALRRREYATTAAMTLYVDPTGSNTNGCTSTGTAACATLTGALAKVPQNVKHDVTINVAAGTYTDQATIGPFTFTSTTTTGPTFSIVGTLGLATVATGTNSGSITAFTDQPDTGTTTGLLTDGTQAWTTDNLKGRFLRITSGTNNGAVRPIISNTATTITFIGAFNTDPIVGDTYTISTPSSVFSTGLMGVIGLNGRATFQLSNVDLTQSSTVAFTLDNNNLRSINLGSGSGTTFRLTQSSTSSALTLGGTRLTSNAGAAVYIEGGVPLNLFGSTSATVVPVVNMGTAYLRSTGTAAALSALSGAGGTFNVNSTGTVYFEIPSGASALTPALLITLNMWVNPSARTALMVNCNGAGAAAFAINATTGRPLVPTRLDLYNTNVINCPTAFDIRNGANVNVASGGTTTFTTVTNEVRFDNATTYTYATINGFSPKSVRTSLGTSFTISQP